MCGVVVYLTRFVGLLDNSVLGFNCVSFDLALFAACGCELMI